MIDTHCHLDLAIFDIDRAAVLARSRQAGIDQWLIPGINLAGVPSIIALRTPSIHIALGLHPLFSHPSDALQQLRKWVTQANPLAIGEIGLDYFPATVNRSQQVALFTSQLTLAEQIQRPVLLHVRKAHDEVLYHLRQQHFSYGGIVHGFNGSLQQAHHYLDLGFCMGFGGVVTRERALRIRRLAVALPETALVLETDSPDLPPAGRHGERNEPCHLRLVAQTMAQLRQVSLTRMLEVSHHNAQAVLGFNR